MSSTKRVCLEDISVLSEGVPLPPYIDVHAIMVVLAWGFLIPCGVVMLRVLRFTSLYEKEIKGFSVLIIMHGSVNTLGLFLTMISGIYMIIETGGFEKGLHAVFGTVVLFLCTIQGLLGFIHFFTFCSLKLYWVHRCLGGVLTFSSLLNIFLGIKRVVDSGAPTVSFKVGNFLPFIVIL